MSERAWAWSLAQQGGRQVAAYAVFIVLARLLTPHDFGLVALATAWIGLLGVFSEVGFGSALVQRAQITSAHLSSTFFLNTGIGLLITLLGMAASWPLSRVLGAPEVQPVMLALSLGFLINSLGLTHMALVYRELRFKELAIRDLIATLLGGAVGLAADGGDMASGASVAQTLATSATASHPPLGDAPVAAAEGRCVPGGTQGAVGVQLEAVRVQSREVSDSRISTSCW